VPASGTPLFNAEGCCCASTKLNGFLFTIQPQTQFARSHLTNRMAFFHSAKANTVCPFTPNKQNWLFPNSIKVISLEITQTAKLIADAISHQPIILSAEQEQGTRAYLRKLIDENNALWVIKAGERLTHWGCVRSCA